jgi:3-oxoadipate enol-lactonase
MIEGAEGHDEGVAILPDGGGITYELHGRAHPGVPVLLLRPLGGAMALWGAFRDVLAEKLRVVSFDLRGTGRSTAEPRRWLTTRDLARDGLHVLDHLGVRLAHVFGISLGGMTATWLAILAPSRVARLCIASAPARGLELTRAGLRRELALAACFVRPRADVEASLVARILSPKFRVTHPEAVHRIERLIREAPASRASLLEHALAGVMHDARRQLRNVECPTLVLAGDRDTLLGAAAPHALADAIQGAAFELVAGAGHDLTLEQPIVTATRVSEFFLA